MKSASILAASAAICAASAASADITGAYGTKYSVTAEDRNGAVVTRTIIDLYVSSDDDADTVLGVFNFNLVPDSAQLSYFHATVNRQTAGRLRWQPENLGGNLDVESVRWADTFVTIGGFEQGVLRPEQSPGAGEGCEQDSNFANPFDPIVSYPQANAGWWNTTPGNLAGQVGQVPLAGPDGEPSEFGLGVLIARFSYHGDFSIDGSRLDLAWNQGPGTAEQQGEFTVESETVTMAADINGDRSVNVADLLAVISAWGHAGPEDVDGDGSVGVGDLLCVLSAWDGSV